MASLFQNFLVLFGFLKRSFESKFIKHLIKVFFTHEMTCHSITLTVHFVHGFAGRLIFISLIQLSQSKSCIFSWQVSPFRLRLSISTRNGFLLQGRYACTGAVRNGRAVPYTAIVLLSEYMLLRIGMICF